MKKLKKSCSILLVIVLLIVGNLNLVISASAYNADSAIDYARTYAYNYNYNYSSYSGNDCANFVSQCLYAGGLNTDGTWYPGSLAWINCTALTSWFVNNGFERYYPSSGYDVSKGDVLFTNNAGHVVICSDVINGTIKFCGHTNDRLDASISTSAITYAFRIGNNSPVTMWDFNKPATYPSYNGYLKSGSRDDSAKRVSFMQTCLNWLGYDCGSADGQYGSATTEAIKRFQSDEGIEYDGVIGPETWDRIVRYVGVTDIPDGEYCYIIRQDGWKHLESVGGENCANVQLASGGNDPTDPKQIWKFNKTADGTYIIENAYDGRVLDLSEVKDQNGQNVYVYDKAGVKNQEWVMFYSASGTGLRTAIGNCVLDCNGNSKEPGTNIHVWERHGREAQSFNLYMLKNDNITYSKPSKPSVPVITVTTPSSSNPYTTISWNSVPLVNKFDKRTYNITIKSSTHSYVMRKGWMGTSYTLTLPAGNYTFTLQAVNSYYSDYYSSVNKSFSISSEYKILNKTVSYKNNVYKFYSGNLPWESAKKYAESTGGHLATITSEDENNFINENNNIGYCWLGATDSDKEGTFKWITGETFSYTAWYSGQPDNSEGNENYLGTFINGKWNDFNSEAVDIKGFIVEYEHTTHTWDAGKITKTATCTTAGTKLYTCTVCSETKTETISKNLSNHTGETEIRNVKSATCANDGYTGDTYCKGCGIKLSSGTTVKATGNHNWNSGSITTAATCKSTGVKTYTCTVCKTTKTETISKNSSNHTDGTEIRNAAESTCGKCGYTGDTYCKGCGIRLYSGYNIPATEAHTWNSGTVTAPATCKAEGVKTYTCTVCLKTKTNSISKTDHKDTDSDGKCDVCGYVMTVVNSEITVLSVKGVAEQDVTVPVKIERNEGFSYMKLTVVYDSSKLKFNGAENGTVSTDAFSVSGNNIVWDSAVNADGNGVLVNLKFTVISKTENEEYPVTVKLAESYNSEENDVYFKIIPGSIKVSSVIYGDVNGDKEINGKDVVRLRKYLVDLDEKTNTSSVEITAGADCNGDGVVTGKDLIRLRKYLVDYDETTGTSDVELGK